MRIVLLIYAAVAVVAGVQGDWWYCLIFVALASCSGAVSVTPAPGTCLCCPNPRLLGGDFCHDCGNELAALDTHMAKTHESLPVDYDCCDRCGDRDCFECL